MRVIVLGAGTVGTWVADLLCQNRHSVTVVDSDPEMCRQLNDELDVAVVTGSASQASVMFQAGVLGADVLLALTGNDEVNFVAASMAKAMGVRRSIARVYAPVFRDLSTFDYQRHFNIDRLLSIEHLSAIEIAHHIRNPGSVIMENFARGELEVKEVIVSEKSDVVGQPLKALKLGKGIRLGSINRDQRTWIAGAEDMLQAGDRITLLGEREKQEDLAKRFNRKQEAHMHVVIAGGGETGYHLARALEGDRISILLMDESHQRCEYLAANLKHTTVVNVDATRRSVLEEERVGKADVFVACTGEDENNIMACVEAREIGAKSIMALISRPDYANVVHKLGIDVAVSPRDVMAKQVLSFLNTGPIISRMQLPGSSLHVVEIEVPEGSLATEHVLANLKLPSSSLVAAVIQDDYVSVPGADDRLRAGSTVLLLVDESSLQQALDLFRASR
jgi:trk system potassium uptake protein